ncbi:VacJ family lipoprotein [Crenobacter sp. SG2305]|uniref:MlaA family lipoprotein n=1 Tax=Crenobacter oryzisoli TaxID=3056844 RepID=UPI0025AAC5B4|nr:VacJ family lipoprotein [Crenobacter sp. SG2305]MDN0085022.1 VacJ family lipoprotein [Crenobacter sp. SG2305]
MNRSIRTLTVSATLLVAGCATHPSNPQDPYESYNRAMYAVNDRLDRAVIKPAAQGYRAITPQPVRNGISNFFDNFRDMYSAASNLLRGHVEDTLNDIMRVALNSTFGLGGLLDIADPAKLKNNKTTLGDTFASWGWKNSNYFVMPILGPSTVRDGLGTATTLAVPGPEHRVYENTDGGAYIYWGLNGISTREKLLDVTNAVDEAAVDRYSYTRDAYMQLRAKQVGAPLPKPSDSDANDMNIDELVAPTGGAASAPAGEVAKPAASAPAAAPAPAH